MAYADYYDLQIMTEDMISDMVKSIKVGRHTQVCCSQLANTMRRPSNLVWTLSCSVSGAWLLHTLFGFSNPPNKH